MCCQTVFAQTVECYYAFLDRTLKVFGNRRFKAFRIEHMEIRYAAAFAANKVVVRIYVVVEAENAVISNDFLNLFFFGKKRKISVNRSEADVRVYLTDVGIHHISRGVIGPAFQVLDDRLPLSAELPLLHRVPPETIIVTVTIIIHNKVDKSRVI